MRLILLFLLTAACFAADPIEIRVVFDNTAEPGFEKGWGFAAVVSRGGRRVLFDTGGNADIFLRNLKALGVEPGALEHVVISHRHSDHTAGLQPLQALNPKLALHWPDPAEPYQILPGFHSTGTLAGPTPEQALVLDTPQGLVIITGCSHPGIVRMVEAALQQHKASRVRFLIGGFHMLQQSPQQVSTTVARLQELKVERIAATHCTGDQAIARFRQAFSGRFETAGAGRVITLP